MRRGEAIGGGEWWACAGGRAIGGDVLAMQVHAGWGAHLPTLISGSAYTSQLRAQVVLGGRVTLAKTKLGEASFSIVGRIGGGDN